MYFDIWVLLRSSAHKLLLQMRGSLNAFETYATSQSFSTAILHGNVVSMAILFCNLMATFMVVNTFY